MQLTTYAQDWLILDLSEDFYTIQVQLRNRAAKKNSKLTTIRSNIFEFEIIK